MQNSKIIFGLVIMMIMMGCARKPVYKSTWRQPTNDEKGISEDCLEGMRYDSESGIMYSLSNDQENLYVKIKFANNILQQKVVKTGLTFWIDTTGKKKKQLGLVFPIESSSNPLPRAQKSRMGNYNSGEIAKRQIDTAMFNAKFRDGTQSMQLLNYFGEGRADMMDNKNKEGINAILSIDAENILWYEAELSLQKIFPDPEKFLNDSTQYFSFGIETGKLEMPTNGNEAGKPQMNLSGGRGSGGVGQRGGGQGRGARQSGANPQMDSDKMAMMRAMSVESKVWVKKARLNNHVNN